MAIALLALCASTALAIVNCSGHTPTPAPPPPRPIDENLLALSPAGAQLVLWIDLAQLRASAVWDIVELLLDSREYEEIRAATGIEPLHAVDEILVSVAQKPQGNDAFVAVIKGRFDAPAAMRSMAAADKGQIAERNDFVGVVGEKMLMFAVTDHTVVVSTENAIDATLGLANRKGRSLEDDPRFVDMPIGTDAAAVLRYRKGPTAPDLSRFRARSPINDIDKILKLDASATISAGLEVAWSFVVDDKLAAAAAARELSDLADDLSRNTFVMLIGLDWLFDRVTVMSSGTKVRVQISLDKADVEQLRRLALKLRKIRELGQPGEGKLERKPSGNRSPTLRKLRLPPTIKHPKIESSKTEQTK